MSIFIYFLINWSADKKQVKCILPAGIMFCLLRGSGVAVAKEKRQTLKSQKTLEQMEQI